MLVRLGPILADAILAAGQTLTVSGALLMANETMTFAGSQQTNGFLRLFGGGRRHRPAQGL